MSFKICEINSLFTPSEVEKLLSKRTTSIYISRSPQHCNRTRAVANYNHLKFFKINFRIPKIPPIQPISFGQFLRKLRFDKKLSQGDLARLLGVSHDSIRNWEGDRFLPNRKSQEKLAKIFGLNAGTLSEFVVECL